MKRFEFDVDGRAVILLSDTILCFNAFASWLRKEIKRVVGWKPDKELILYMYNRYKLITA